MVDYAALEVGIVTALYPLQSELLDIMAWPDNDAEFNKPIARSRITIVYHSSEFQSLISTSEAIQPETVAMQLMIESRSLRGENGIYDLKEKVLDKVQGLKIPNWDKLTAQSFQMAQRDGAGGGIWRFNLHMKTTGQRQQIINDYPDTENINWLSDSYGKPGV